MFCWHHKYIVCTSEVNGLPSMMKQLSEYEKKLLMWYILETQQVWLKKCPTLFCFLFFVYSKYPCDQAVISSEVPRGDGRSAKGSISCGDETKQTSNVPFTRSSQGSCKYEGLEKYCMSRKVLSVFSFVQLKLWVFSIEFLLYQTNCLTAIMFYSNWHLRHF